MTQITALSVVAVTVGLSLGRPRIGPVRIHHGSAGVIGAALTVLLGIGPPDVLVAAARILAAPIVTLVSLMLMTQVAERAGLFELLGASLAQCANGSGPRLFVYVFFAGTLIGTVFTNDAAVLILTPIVFSLVERMAGSTWTAENKLPFYFGVLYVANLVGALVIANPINLVVANLLGIGFLEFALWMVLPSLASILVSFAGLWVCFRHSIPKSFQLPSLPENLNSKRRLQALCAMIIAATMLGFFMEAITGIPTWCVALMGAVFSLMIHKAFARGKLAPLFQSVGWDVIIFMAGMFVVGLGLRHVGVTHSLGRFIERVSGGQIWAMRTAVGLLAGTCSAIINNHPTADLMAFTIQDLALSVPERKSLAFAALIGGDLGPKMLPIGSLAALIWFRLLRDRGVNVSYAQYIRIGVPITLAALVVALAVLNVQSLWFSTR